MRCVCLAQCLCPKETGSSWSGSRQLLLTAQPGEQDGAMALGGAGQGGPREGGCLYWGGRGENNLELGGTLNLLGWLRGE